MTTTTMGAQPTRRTGRGRGGGDAQERPATNPVAALPCARTPLLHPLSTPLLHPLLAPSAATVSPHQSPESPFELVEESDPGRSRPGSVGKLQLWRATRSRLHAGAFMSGRPPTNFVGGLPAGSPGYPDHERRSDG